MIGISEEHPNYYRTSIVHFFRNACLRTCSMLYYFHYWCRSNFSISLQHPDVHSPYILATRGDSALVSPQPSSLPMSAATSCDGRKLPRPS